MDENHRSREFAVLKANADFADSQDYADSSVASVRAGFAGALMTDHSSEEHLIAIQEAFFRAVIGHQCGR